MVLPALDGIMAADPTGIVILFSDHGTRYHGASDPVAAASFFAARTPGKVHVFPDDVSPVNLMAHLLNGYFDVGLPIQPYRAWLSSDFNGVLDLTPLPD